MATTKSSRNLILQWNCRGIRANRDELHLFDLFLKPACICLQETQIDDNFTFQLTGFNAYAINPSCGGRAHGGSMILVNHEIPHHQITLRTTFQAVAVQITLRSPITLCSLYLPPDYTIDLLDLNDLISQLPKPMMILGDFNAHNTIWGSKHSDNKGKIVEDWINKNNLSLMNSQDPTYIHPLQEPILH